MLCWKEGSVTTSCAIWIYLPSSPLDLNLQAAGLSHSVSFYGAFQQSNGNEGQCLPFRLGLTEAVLRTASSLAKQC